MGGPARDVKPGEKWTFADHRTCAEWGPRRVLVVCPALPAYQLKAIAHAADKGDAPLAADGAAGAASSAFAWLTVAHVVAAYVDHGVDPVMSQVLAAARGCGVDVEYRTLQPDRWAVELLSVLRPAAPIEAPVK